MRIVRHAYRWWLVVVFAMLANQPVHGFYFPNWPGGPKRPPSLLPAGPKHPANPPDRHPESPTDTVPGEGPEGETPATPEPRTAALATVGIGLAGVYRWFRRRR
ncbi:MAG: PEP-CTERM sorting domain-containing protein [Planctomycetia bacterium]|nr:PEP-CTERM sorting domain-containing protein [Planctomycetia bacterium]